jgi:hypothetical protein
MSVGYWSGGFILAIAAAVFYQLMNFQQGHLPGQSLGRYRRNVDPVRASNYSGAPCIPQLKFYLNVFLFHANKFCILYFIK